MEIVWAQILTIILFFTSMFVSCLLPVKIVSTGPRYELGISLANCLSAGVFLATFFIGLLPQVRQQFQFLLHHYQIITKFPVTDFILCIGFFVAFFAEQSIIAYKNRMKRKQIIDSQSSLTECVENLHFEEPASSFISASHTGFSDSHAQHHGHSHDFASAFNDSGVRLGLLVSSLGVHSIFEGMTLGLQTKIHDLFNLFIGVLIHECLVAFAVGVNMTNAKLKLSTAIKLAVLISSTVPIGQIIGCLIGSNNQSLSNDTVSAFLQAIAAGTFIQVTFLEIIPEGLEGERCKFLKILFLMIGFCIIAVVPALTDVHDHKKDRVQDDFKELLKLRYNGT